MFAVYFVNKSQQANISPVKVGTWTWIDSDFDGYCNEDSSRNFSSVLGNLFARVSCFGLQILSYDLVWFWPKIMKQRNENISDLKIRNMPLDVEQDRMIGPPKADFTETDLDWSVSNSRKWFEFDIKRLNLYCCAVLFWQQLALCISPTKIICEV